MADGSSGWKGQSLECWALEILQSVSERVQEANEQGQQDREPLRGRSASERVSEREGFQRFLEVLRGRLPSQRLSVLLPVIVLPLELSPSVGKGRRIQSSVA